MFAGNFTGRTQTLPLAIYTALESNLDAARALSVVLVMVAFGLLLLLHARAPSGSGGRAVAGPGATPTAAPGAAPGARET
jgi:molybdate transport system permease protein